AVTAVLSRGRVTWAAGRGFDRVEFEAFGVPVEESSDRFRECVEIVLAAWQRETLSYRGKYWSYDGIEVLPKPLQSPHPPVWLAATPPPPVPRAAGEGHGTRPGPRASLSR